MLSFKCLGRQVIGPSISLTRELTLLNYVGSLGLKRKQMTRHSTHPTSTPLTLTLAILKPDLMLHPRNLKQVHQRILEHNFLVVRSKVVQLSSQQAEQFYLEHKGRFFCNRLVTFMSSGPCQPLLLARQDAIQTWRDLMGPTKVFRSRFTHPASIRGRYGLSDTRNCSHGSDSTETASREIEFFFPGFRREEEPLLGVQQWVNREEEPLLGGQHGVTFDWNNFVHRLDGTMGAESC